MADGGHECAGVEELVVAEDGGPGVRPAQCVEDRTDAVREAADREEYQGGDPPVVPDIGQYRDGDPA